MMVRIGGFRKTQNRIRLQRPRGRFISPYQTGGTIFGKSTTTRYPSMYSPSPALERWMKKHLQQRGKMKGGTIFGKSTRMRRQNPLRFPSMSQENDMMIERWLKQRMKGGTIFSDRRRNNPFGFPSTSTQINPEPWRVKQALRRMKGGDLRKVLWANQAKARRQRQGIKRKGR